MHTFPESCISLSIILHLLNKKSELILLRTESIKHHIL